MKSTFYFVMISMLPIGAGFAQATTTGATNRRQELYDQYNSYAKKPVSSTASSAPMATESTTTQVDQPQPASKPVEQASMDAPENQRQPEVADINRPGVRIGFRGGVTYPIFTDSRPYSTPRLGFAGGVTLTIGRGVISFQPEINYARYNVKTNLGFGASTFANDYVEVPLLLKIATGTYAGNRFFMTIGPYASYTSSASVDGKKVDVSNTKGRLGFGAAAGIGTALRAGPGHVTLEVRGLYSLGDTYNGFSTNTNTILGQATLGYIFLLGGR